jgi:tetratricopeptide (TPR) repeat protein
MLAALAVVAVGSKWSGSVPVALLAGGCLGAGLGLQRREENTTASSRGNRWLATLRAVVLACFLLVVCLASAASNLLTGAGRPDSALAVWPFDTSARLRLGLSTESCEDIAVSHSVEPDLYKGLALGNCLARRNQHEAARDTYRQVLAWKPDHAAAHGNLAVALKALGDLDGAWRHGRRALSLRPSDPSIRRIWKHVCEGNVHCER